MNIILKFNGNFCTNVTRSDERKSEESEKSEKNVGEGCAGRMREYLNCGRCTNFIFAIIIVKIFKQIIKVFQFVAELQLPCLFAKWDWD